MALELGSLSDGPGFTYDDVDLTLTAGVNASINQFGVGGDVTQVRDLINGDYTLVSLTDDDKERAGRYVITDVGGPDLWSSGTTYAEEDQVQRGNILWGSLVNSNLNNNPYTDLVSWEPLLISPVGAAGASTYGGGTTYAAGVVVDSSGVLYVSRAGSNTGHTPASSAAWWTAIPGVGGMKSTPGPLVLTRADDFNADDEILPGSYFLVTAGDDAGNFYFLSTTEQTYVLDSTPLEFTKIRTGGGGGGTYTAGDGLTLTSTTFSVKPKNASGAINVDTNGVSVRVDDNTLAIDGGSNNLQIKNGGVHAGAFNSDALGDGIGTNGGGALQVNLEGGTLARSATGLKVADQGITGNQINSSVAGNGLTGGGGSALAVGAGSGITVNANDVAVDVDDSTIQVGGSGVELKDGGTTRAKLATAVLNTIATGGASGTTATTHTGTGTAATFNVPVNTTVFAEIVLEAVNDNADSKRFIQKGYIGYRRGPSGNAFPVGDTEDVTLLPAFAATGTGSIAALTWTTLALSDNSGNVQVNVVGPGGSLDVTYRCRVRLY